MRYISCLLFLLIFSTWGFKSPESITARISESAVVDGDTNFFVTIADSSYWKEVTPIDFLDTLILYGKNYKFYILIKPNRNWYNDSCIETLRTYLSNKSSCSSVFNRLGWETYVPDCGTSTVGQEANYLITGIEKRNYPIAKSSSCYFKNKK